MAIKTKLLRLIKIELKNAKKIKFQRMIDTLTFLLSLFKSKNIGTDESILKLLDELIIERGNTIVKHMKKNNSEKIEKEMFEQNIYNRYVSDFKYKKYRPIYYKRDVEGFVNTDLKEDVEPLTFLIK